MLPKTISKHFRVGTPSTTQVSPVVVLVQSLIWAETVKRGKKKLNTVKR